MLIKNHLIKTLGTPLSSCGGKIHHTHDENCAPEQFESVVLELCYVQFVNSDCWDSFKYCQYLWYCSHAWRKSNV